MKQRVPSEKDSGFSDCVEDALIPYLQHCVIQRRNNATFCLLLVQAAQR